MDASYRPRTSSRRARGQQHDGGRGIALGTDPALGEGDQLLRLVEPAAPEPRDSAYRVGDGDERVVAAIRSPRRSDRLTAPLLSPPPGTAPPASARSTASPARAASRPMRRDSASLLEVALGVGRPACPERSRPEADQHECPQVLAEAGLHGLRLLGRRQQPRCLRGHRLDVVAGPCHQQAQRRERDLQPGRRSSGTRTLRASRWRGDGRLRPASRWSARRRPRPRRAPRRVRRPGRKGAQQLVAVGAPPSR